MQNMFHDPKNIIPLTQFAQEGASSIRERLQNGGAPDPPPG